VLDAQDLKYERITHLLCFFAIPGFSPRGSAAAPRFAKIAPVVGVQKLSGAFQVGGRAVAVFAN
jgi:hypothetical protein